MSMRGWKLINGNWEFSWQIQRYCFRSKTVEQFFYCDNCGLYFCRPHHDHDDEYGPFHKECT